jgi:hypothetical protein
MSDSDNNEEVDEGSVTPALGLDPNIAGTIVENQISEPKSSIGLFDLPCGYVDGDGTLHTEIKVREITGHEEDMLANRKLKSNKKLNELITRCVERIGTITDKGQLSKVVLDMTVGDRLFAIFAIRRVTVGDLYTYQVKCSQCQAIDTVTMDLSVLEVKHMPDPLKREFEVTLPKSGVHITFSPMTGRGEEKLSTLAKRTEDALSLALLMRLTEIDGSRPSLKAVKDMSSVDRIFLRDAFTKVEGGVETTIDHECPECYAEFKEELDVSQAGFFFPTVAQES